MNTKSNHQNLHSFSNEDLQMLAGTNPRLPLNREDSKLNSLLTFVNYKNALFFGPMDASQLKEGVGLILYDNGDILAARFIDDKVEGHFFYFKSGQIGLCFYGAIKKGKIEDDCYIYSRSKEELLIKFKEGKETESTHYSDKIESFISESEMREKDTTTYSQVHPFPNSHKNVTFNSKTIKPLQFIETYLVKEMNEKSYLKKEGYSNRKLNVSKILENQKFFGGLINGKPNGLGILFEDDWPVCYGTFVNGSFSGMGRVEQSDNLTLDGIFRDSQLTEGWVIDYLNVSSHFGCLISKKDKKLDDQEKIYQRFNFQKSYKRICNSLIEEYRQQHHIKSLTYINEFCEEVDIDSIIPTKFIMFMMRKELEARTEKEKFGNFFPSLISSIPSNEFCESKFDVENESSISEQSLICLMEQLKENVFKKETLELDNKSKTEQAQISSSSTQEQILKSVIKNKTNIFLSKTAFNEADFDDENQMQQKKLEESNKKGQKSKRANCLNLQDIYKKYLKAL